MESLRLLSDFERIIILKTLIFDIDLVFISKNNLEEIAYRADEMEIDLDFSSFDKLDYPTYDELLKIYEEWKTDILEKYNTIKDDLLKKING